MHHLNTFGSTVVRVYTTWMGGLGGGVMSNAQEFHCNKSRPWGNILEMFCNIELCLSVLKFHVNIEELQTLSFERALFKVIG